MLFSLDEGALKLIGICISILGLVSLFALIQQRKSSVLDPSLLKLQDEKKKYNVTKKNTPTASIKVIENFNEEISKDEDLYGMSDLDAREEGFAVLGEKKIVFKTNITSPDNQEGTISSSSMTDTLSAISDLENENLSEGFRVVGKSKVESHLARSKSDNTSTYDTEQDNLFEQRSAQNESGELRPNVSTEENKEQELSNKLSSLRWETLIDDEKFPSNHPKQELDFFLQRILRAIKSTGDNHTVSFVLFDSEKQLLKIESLMTDDPKSVLKVPRIPLGSDILSTIAISNKPTIISSIAENGMCELLPYYTRNIGIKSFIGIPITYGSSVVGVLSMDSKEEKAFNELTATFLGHFTKLLSGLIQSYSEKYDLKQLADSYSAISNFRLLSADSSATQEVITHSLASTLNLSFEPNDIGVVLYDHEEEKWVLTRHLSSGDKNYTGMTIGRDTALSNCINEAELVNWIGGEEGLVINSEITIETSRGCQVYIVPLRTMDSVFGCFFIISANSVPLGITAVQMMEVLAEYAAIAIEKIYLSKIIRENAFYNSATGLLNHNAFLDRLQEEVVRAEDYGYESSLILLSIDEYDALNGKDELNRVVVDMISHVVSSNIRSYDFCGHYGDKFCIVTVHTKESNAKVWAEKIRNAIASETVKSDNSEYNITISAGIVQFGEGLQRESGSLISLAQKAINANKATTNTVALFS